MGDDIFVVQGQKSLAKFQETRRRIDFKHVQCGGGFTGFGPREASTAFVDVRRHCVQKITMVKENNNCPTNRRPKKESLSKKK